MKSKRNYKKIIALVLMIMFTLTVFNPVNAALTDVGGGTVCEELYEVDAEGNPIFKDGKKIPIDLDKDGKTDTRCISQPNGKVSSDVGSGVDTVGKVISYIVGILIKSFTWAPIAIINTIISGLSITLILVLNTVFSLGTGNWASAMPDSIIFNTVPFLDVNFINPHKLSFYAQLTVGSTSGNLAANLFQSFRALAMTVMIIALMITGLKLALSTVAAKKAQYKEAVLKWLTGFVILLALKWILAGIFYINELIVANLAATAADSRFDIAIQLVDTFPGWARIFADLFKLAASGWGDSTGSFMHVEGFWGIIIFNLIRAFQGDIVSSIVGFVIIGQSFVVMSHYFKRLFMSFILGVVSPLVVAVDTINGIMGTKSSIFKSWLKTFLFTVFIQSIHAAYLVVMLYILKSIYQAAFMNYLLQSILTIWWMTGLVKLEKIVKGLFGFGDSLAGSLADGSKGFKKALQAGMGLAAAAKSIGDNAQKAKAANEKKTTAKTRVQDLEAKINKRTELERTREAANEAAGKARESGNMMEVFRQLEIQKNANNEIAALEEGTDPVKAAINSSSSKSTTLDDELAAARADYDAASREARGANLANIMGPANLAAGIGIGIGSGDDMSEALFKGGMITSALDKTSEFVGRASYDVSSGKVKGAIKGAIQEDKEFVRSVRDAESGLDRLGVVAKKFAREASRSGEIISSAMNTMTSSASKASSAKPSSSSSQPQQTVNVTVDVAKISNELTKQLSKSMSGIGEEIGKAIRKELKDIDKKVDNE